MPGISKDAILLGVAFTVLVASPLNSLPSTHAVPSGASDLLVTLPPAPSMVGLPIYMDGGPQSFRYPNKAWHAYINEALRLRGYGPIASCQERLNTPANAYLIGCQGKLEFVGSMYTGYAAHMQSLAEPAPRRYASSDNPARRTPIRSLVAYKARFAN